MHKLLTMALPFMMASNSSCLMVGPSKHTSSGALQIAREHRATMPLVIPIHSLQRKERATINNKHMRNNIFNPKPWHEFLAHAFQKFPFLQHRFASLKTSAPTATMFAKGLQLFYPIDNQPKAAQLTHSPALVHSIYLYTNGPQSMLLACCGRVMLGLSSIFQASPFWQLGGPYLDSHFTIDSMAFFFVLSFSLLSCERWDGVSSSWMQALIIIYLFACATTYSTFR